MSMSRVTHIVVHYSATYADQNIRVEDIRKMHVARGFRTTGYHWFIGRDGREEIGRPEHEIGAHVGGQNSGKIGICWAGGLERSTGANVGVDNRTAAQTATLINRIREILKKHPNAKVVGHRDLGATQCPAFDVASWWAGVQGQPKPAPKPVAPAPVTTPGVGEDLLHTVERGETWFGIAREHGIPLVALLSMNNATDKDVLVVGRQLVVRREQAAPHLPATAPAPQATGLLAWLIALLFGKKP